MRARVYVFGLRLAVLGVAGRWTSNLLSDKTIIAFKTNDGSNPRVASRKPIEGNNKKI